MLADSRHLVLHTTPIADPTLGLLVPRPRSHSALAHAHSPLFSPSLAPWLALLGSATPSTSSGSLTVSSGSLRSLARPESIKRLRKTFSTLPDNVGDKVEIWAGKDNAKAAKEAEIILVW